MISKLSLWAHCVHRHIGGLEIASPNLCVWLYVHRHIGGLERVSDILEQLKIT